jgi:CRISPR-associated protein (TIGR03984 family)
LRLNTLQQVRLFGPQAEVLLWRDGDEKGKARWRARLISEEEVESAAWSDDFDESQMVWGTDVVLSLPPNPPPHFTLMSDGAQGLRHAVPLQVAGEFDERSRPLRLIVRNYLEEDETGFVRVAASRLVEVKK